MNATHPFSLRYTPERLADFCRQVRERTRDTAAALQQLTAVQAFLSGGVEEPNHPGYREAMTDLGAQIDALRERLLGEHAAALGIALERRDAAAIASSFTALSRSGFGESAARAWAALDTVERAELGTWIAQQCRTLHEQAVAAGRYPDAPDFAAAGIDLEVYLALQELKSRVCTAQT